MQLKEAIEQQANAFKEAIQEQHLQFIKEKEKLLQHLQDTIKQNQGIKAQLEASHQRALSHLKKSKNQELKVRFILTALHKFFFTLDLTIQGLA